MIFESIAVQNFCSVEHAEFSYQGHGVVLVDGENNDVSCASSNGSGKSTLLVDALVWALFGRTTKGQAADNILPSWGKAGTAVIVKLTLRDGRRVRIERYRKHIKRKSSTFLYVNDEDHSASTVPATDKLITSLLKTNYDKFLREVVFGQGVFFRFSALTEQSRREVIEEILGLGIFDSARLLAKRKATDIGKSIAAVNGTLEYARKTLAQRNEELLVAEQVAKNEADNIATALRIAEDRLNKLTQELQNCVVGEVPDLSAFDRELQAKETEIANLRTAIGQFETIIMTSQVGARSANDTIGRITGLSANPTCPTCEQPIVPGSLDTQLADARSVHEQCSARVSEMSKRVATLRDSVSVKEREARDISARRASATTDYNARNNHRMVLETAVAGAQGEVDRVRNTPRTAADVVSRASAAVDDAVLDVARYEGQLEALSVQEDIAKFWASGFQDLRSKLISQVLEFLNSRLKRYLAVLTDNEIMAEVRLTENDKIDLAVTTAGGSYNSASGGEKDRVDIACSLALHDLAMDRSSSPPNILVLDEIANYVDAAGVSRLMALVTDKLRSVESVFVVSQNPTFRAHAHAVWTVSKTAGRSSLQTSTALA